MAEFNNIDDDFCCPFQCALTTMLGGPSACPEKMQAGECVHPVAAEVDPRDVAIGALTTNQTLRVFSSVFQRAIALITDASSGRQFLAFDEAGEFTPITEVYSAEDEPQTDAIPTMMDMLSQIQELPEYDGPVQ